MRCKQRRQGKRAKSATAAVQLGTGGYETELQWWKATVVRKHRNYLTKKKPGKPRRKGREWAKKGMEDEEEK